MAGFTNNSNLNVKEEANLEQVEKTATLRWLLDQFFRRRPRWRGPCAGTWPQGRPTRERRRPSRESPQPFRPSSRLWPPTNKIKGLVRMALKDGWPAWDPFRWRPSIKGQKLAQLSVWSNINFHNTRIQYNSYSFFLATYCLRSWFWAQATHLVIHFE